ncbi:MAG TPA: sensor histidine kinase [Solirubrobacteraceae bacterium]|nr:sensor histidine kinase [Solirubrobacteraceae bacterium]
MTIRRRRYLTLFERVAGINALLLIAAVGVTLVVLAPHRISSLTLNEELAVLVASLGLVGLANLWLLRRVIQPLQALTALARRVDLSRRSERMPSAEPNSEAGELALTFNQMLDRLEAERRDATGRVLAGQEAERLRIAQELHDQVGQELTAVLLVLSRLEARVSDELRPDVVEIEDEVRTSLENVRQIAIELRPEALEDLGLASALAVLGDRFAERAVLSVHESVAPRLPALSPEVELVIYRVAQEALTNVARHSGTDRAELDLRTDDSHLVLTVADDGHGLPAGTAPGTGIRGMRERAQLIGASLSVTTGSAGAGCVVRLDVPLNGSRR